MGGIEAPEPFITTPFEKDDEARVNDMRQVFGDSTKRLVFAIEAIAESPLWQALPEALGNRSPNNLDDVLHIIVPPSSLANESLKAQIAQLKILAEDKRIQTFVREIPALYETRVETRRQRRLSRMRS